MNDRIVLSVEAMEGMASTVSYIAERNPAAAERVRLAILATLEMLACTDPRVEGRTVELAPGVTCRRHYVHPVLILYQRSPGVLEVLSVRHHAREPIAR